ncbi:MAG: pilin [Acetomicrobium sp.]|nr:pilin [Acetomicrobium sp.]
MKESKGFTLVELMIVVAIIGILAAVAVPFYQRYVQKSRLTSLVFPGLHSVETNISTYYAVRGTFTDLSLDSMTRDADLHCVDSVSWGSGSLAMTINATEANCSTLKQLNDLNLIAKPVVSGGKIVSWELSGSLADELGLK